MVAVVEVVGPLRLDRRDRSRVDQFQRRAFALGLVAGSAFDACDAASGWLAGSTGVATGAAASTAGCAAVGGGTEPLPASR